MADKTGLSGKDCQHMTVEYYSKGRTERRGQPEKDSKKGRQNRTGRTGQGRTGQGRPGKGRRRNAKLL